MCSANQAIASRCCSERRAGADVAQIVSYLGAGIYEETLFRLVIFAGSCDCSRGGNAHLF